MNVDKKEIEPKAKAAEADRDRNQAKGPIAILSDQRPMFWFSTVLAFLGTLLTINGFTLLVRLPFLHGH